MDADTARDLIEAASSHPRTRWCHTLIGPGGEAIAHACARGSRPWAPPPAGRDGPAGPRAARLAELLTGLDGAPPPLAVGPCDHRHREDRYTPGRRLKHLVRARTARCCAPGCGAQAITAEIDHTIPHPAGAGCECNLGPPASATTTPSTRPAGNSSRPSPESWLDNALGPHLHHPPHPVRRIMLSPSAVSGGTRSERGAPG